MIEAHNSTFSATGTTSYSAIPTLSSAIDAAPSLVPNILDPTAPNAQNECPGYSASNIVETAQGVTADLTLAGEACDVYGIDVVDLTLTVEYQTPERLNVQIVPRYLVPSNRSQYILPAYLTGYPSADGQTTASTAQLNFTYTNDPTFQFQVSRSSSGDVLFSTYGKKIVFEDQFLELATSMPSDYNLYGLGENTHSTLR